MQAIAMNYLMYTSPNRIEAPYDLREAATKICLSPELQEMPWQLRKLQREAMEDLKYAYQAFTRQETQSFLVAAVQFLMHYNDHYLDYTSFMTCTSYNMKMHDTGNFETFCQP